MRSVLILLLGASLGLSGCTGGAATKAAPSTPIAPAPTAEATAETGAITGLVVDDEQQPIAGAEIALTPLSLKAKADVSGAFTFNDLDPGTYTVYAQMLGYMAAARKVEVRIGEITNATIQLTPVLITAEGYHTSLPHTSFIQAGNGLVMGALQFVVTADTKAVVDAMCNSCSFPIYIALNPVQVVTEAWWTAATVPGTNELAEYWFFFNNGTTYLERDAEDVYLENRESHVWTEASVAQLKKVGYIDAQLIAGEVQFSFQHKVETWNTFAYNAELPEDFTALPPE